MQQISLLIAKGYTFLPTLVPFPFPVALRFAAFLPAAGSVLLAAFVLQLARLRSLAGLYGPKKGRFLLLAAVPLIGLSLVRFWQNDKLISAHE